MRTVPTLRSALRAWGLIAMFWAACQLPSAIGADVSSWPELAGVAAWPLALWALLWACSLPRRHPAALDIEALAWGQPAAEPPASTGGGEIRRVERAAIAPAAQAPDRARLA